MSIKIRLGFFRVGFWRIFLPLVWVIFQFRQSLVAIWFRHDSRNLQPLLKHEALRSNVPNLDDHDFVLPKIIILNYLVFAQWYILEIDPQSEKVGYGSVFKGFQTNAR